MKKPLKLEAKILAEVAEKLEVTIEYLEKILGTSNDDTDPDPQELNSQIDDLKIKIATLCKERGEKVGDERKLNETETKLFEKALDNLLLIKIGQAKTVEKIKKVWEIIPDYSNCERPCLLKWIKLAKTNGEKKEVFNYLDMDNDSELKLILGYLDI